MSGLQRDRECNLQKLILQALIRLSKNHLAGCGELPNQMGSTKAANARPVNPGNSPA